jgi:hypothetical protein
MDLMPYARIVAVFAFVLLVVTGLLFLAVKFNIPWGKLLGDIVDKRGNFPCVIPLFFFAVVFFRDYSHSNILLALLNKRS